MGRSLMRYARRRAKRQALSEIATQQRRYQRSLSPSAAAWYALPGTLFTLAFTVAVLIVLGSFLYLISPATFLLCVLGLAVLVAVVIAMVVRAIVERRARRT